MTCLVVAHGADSKACTQFAQRGRETFEIVGGRSRNEIDVEGLPERAGCLRSEAADDQAVDIVR